MYGKNSIFGLLDVFRAGQVRYMCGNACWMVGWVEKKREYVFFWPVGWLDDQPGLIYVWKDLLDGWMTEKNRDIVFENTPLDCWMGKKKRESLLFLACWMDSELVKPDICVEKPVGWLDGSKKYGTVFFFGLLDGFQTGQV